MAGHFKRFRLGSHDENRYSIIPLPEDVHLAVQCRNEMKRIIEKMAPKTEASPLCVKHPDKFISSNCKTCGNLLICEECHNQNHIDHSIESIQTWYQTIRSRLQTAKRNMDKINDRCKIANDENQNEENQIISLFDKLQSDFQESQDIVFERLRKKESELDEYEKKELMSITSSKEADERLYEVEAIESITDIEAQIEALEMQKRTVQGKLEAKLKERRKRCSKELDELRADVKKKRTVNNTIEEQLEMNATTFRQVFKALKEVSDVHATQCQEAIDGFLKRYRELTTKMAAFDNGSTSLEFLQDLASLTGESSTDMNDIAQEDFVIEIPQVQYRSDEESSDLGTFVIYPGDVERLKFTWAREFQKMWYVENISGLSNQLIAVVTRKRGNRETVLDILTHKGEQLVSHKLTKRFAESYHFVCAVSPHKVAICCECEISIMNIDTGTIEDTVKLNKGEEVWQVAYNRITREIVVGLIGSNELRVYGHTLVYLRSVNMSTTMKAPLSLAVSGDDIFVCTYENRAFVLDGDNGNVRTTFSSNGVENRAWRICCDSLKMVYVMWLMECGVVSVIRYSMEGEPLSCLDVDSGMRFLSFALIQNGAEQLIVASEEGDFSINRTPSIVEDAMVKVVDNISLSKYLGVMSIWKPM